MLWPPKPGILYFWLVITMEVWIVPTLRLKVLNKHNTHSVHQDRESYLQFNKQLTHNVHINKGLNITMCKVYSHTHTHTHTRACACVRARAHTSIHIVQTDQGWRTVLLNWNIWRRELSSVLVLKEERVAERLMSSHGTHQLVSN